MPHFKLRRDARIVFSSLSWATACAFCLSLLWFPQASSWAQEGVSAQSEETFLRAVVERYFDASGKKDLAGVVALWSEKSPNFAASKQNLQQQFASNDLKFGDPAISRVKVGGEKASLRVAIALTSIDIKSGQKSEQRLVRAFEFVKEGGEWKVWRYAPAADDLAEALVKANKTERAKLLEADTELVTRELGRALLAQGRRLFIQSSYARATEIYELALDLAEQLGDKEVTATALRGMGAVQQSQGNYPAALEQHQKSLKISEQIGYKIGIAGALNNIGIIRQSQGDYTEALEQYQKGLKIFEAINDKVGISTALHNIGITYWLQGNYIEALEKHRQSLKISEEIGNKPLIASTLSDSGHVYLTQGNYTEALEQFQRSLKISEDVGDKAGIANTLNGIGTVHDRQGHSAQALEQYQKSLKIAEEIGNKVGVATASNNIGICHYMQGNYVAALEQYQKGLKIYEALGDRSNIAHALHNIGRVYAAQGNYTLALEQHQKSLKIAEEIGDQGAITNILENFGEVHLALGDYNQVVQFTERAADLALQIGLTDGLWEARTTAGEAHLALKQFTQARRSFDQAIAVIEAQRANVVGGAQDQQRHFEFRFYPYRSMVELLVTQNDPGEALIYAERAKARTLLDVLSGGHASMTKTMTGPEIEQERKLNGQLVSLNTQIYREKQRKQPDQEQLKLLDSQLQKARLDFEAFQANLYIAHPELKTQRGEAPPLRLEQLSSLLPDTTTALLEFVVAKEKAYLFVVTKSAGVKVYPLEIKRKDLTARIEQFHWRLANKDSDFQELSQELYRLLLKPAEVQLEGKSRLLIVPDGSLWELPFQALQTSRNRYLIDDYIISYAPSLTVLREMNNARIKKERSFKTQSLLALGNPALGEQTVKRVKSVMMDERLDPLPEAEQQVRALGRIYGPGHSKVYIGAEAREERFKAEANGYEILHLATHGVFNDRNPMYSHLLLAQTGEAAEEDGMLEAWELMKMDLKADLAVLSACETARGRIGQGEGIIGMTWALFVAGVPRTVVSQWKVRSDSTAKLMIEFHRQLKSQPRGSNSAAAALRAAALKLKSESQYQHPFHWASFVVVGDGS